MENTPLGYGGLLEQARLRRERYEQDSIANAQEADRTGPSNPNMFSNEMRTIHRNSNARAQAAFNPEWDAWFQSTQGAPLSGRGGGGQLLPDSPSMRGLRQQSGPLENPIDTNELLEQSKTSRQRGTQTRKKQGGRVGPYETGRF